VERLSAVLGLLVIAAILWEVFNDLFHPAGSSALSNWIGRLLFEAGKRIPRTLPLAGPAAVGLVIAVWVAGLVIGFALVYYPAYPADFRTRMGTVPADSYRFPATLYFSFETLITLGYGDIVPGSRTIRFVAATEGLIGFGLLTASLTSIVLLYPALSRMRLLARGVAHIVDAERESGISLASTTSDVTLSSLARDVTHARIDLVHFPLVYYFTSADPRAAVPTWARELTRLASEARQTGRPDHVRFAGYALDRALHELAAILDERFLHTKSDDRDVIFRAVAEDHLVKESTS
jgi:hypothetical protein